MKRRDFLKYCAVLPVVSLGGIEGSKTKSEEKRDHHNNTSPPHCDICGDFVWANPYSNRSDGESEKFLFLSRATFTGGEGNINYHEEFFGHEQCIRNCNASNLLIAVEREMLDGERAGRHLYSRIRVVADELNAFFEERDDCLCICSQANVHNYNTYDEDGLVKIWSVPKKFRSNFVGIWGNWCNGIRFGKSEPYRRRKVDQYKRRI